MEKACLSLGMAAAMASAISNADASLSHRPAQNFPGGGLGAANTILTLHNIGNFSFEAGSVGRAFGSATDVISGDIGTGPSQPLD